MYYFVLDFEYVTCLVCVLLCIGLHLPINLITEHRFTQTQIQRHARDDTLFCIPVSFCRRHGPFAVFVM